MPSTRIKICGITRPEDGLCAAMHGADAIGLVFFPPSPRYVELDQARAISESLPPFVMKVAVFVDADPSEISRVVKHVKPDLLQFHGDEKEADCIKYDRPYIKAIRVREDVNIEEHMASYPSARACLLDTHVQGLIGGTGQIFDWKQIPPALSKPVILAGGLNPGNVKDAIQATHPYAVDVSGGVEIEPGIKDEEKIRRFISSVQSVQQSCHTP